MIDSSVILSKKTQTEPCLELHLIRQAYTVAVGLKIGSIIHGLVAVKQRDDILFVDFPILNNSYITNLIIIILNKFPIKAT